MNRENVKQLMRVMVRRGRLIGIAIPMLTLAACGGGGEAQTLGPAVDAGFKSTDDVAAVLVAGGIAADGDFLAQNPSAFSGTTYPSSGNCSVSGSYTASADASTSFTGDGLLTGMNCNSMDSSVTSLLNGKTAYKCTDPAQTTTTCSQKTFDFGTSAEKLSTRFKGFGLDSINTLGVHVVLVSTSTSDTLTQNGTVQTRLTATSPMFDFSFTDFQAIYANGLSVNGTLTMSSNSTKKCFVGRARITTNAEILEDSSGTISGSLSIADANNKSASVLFNADHTVNITLDGITKVYAANDFDAFCS